MKVSVKLAPLGDISCGKSKIALGFEGKLSPNGSDTVILYSDIDSTPRDPALGDAHEHALLATPPPSNAR
jgi:hypothetical protein